MFSNELSNFDILKILKNFKLLNNFGGIYSKDKLPKLRDGTFYIVNMEDHDEGNGTHWVAFYHRLAPMQSIYFDSFGFIPPNEIQEKIMPYVYSDKQIQDIDSSACGWFCIGFIKYLNYKSNKYAAFDIFNNLFRVSTISNDRILHGILY